MQVESHYSRGLLTGEIQFGHKEYVGCFGEAHYAGTGQGGELQSLLRLSSAQTYTIPKLMATATPTLSLVSICIGKMMIQASTARMISATPDEAVRFNSWDSVNCDTRLIN